MDHTGDHGTNINNGSLLLLKNLKIQELIKLTEDGAIVNHQLSSDVNFGEYYKIGYLKKQFTFALIFQ